MDSQEIANKVIAKAEKIVSRELTPLEKSLIEYTVTQVHFGLAKND